MKEQREQSLESSSRLVIAKRATESLLQYPGNNIDRIILFGSVARGDANQASDIDVCVVFNDSLPRRHVLMLGSVLQDFLEERGFKAHGVHIVDGLDFTFVAKELFDTPPQEGRVREEIDQIKKDGLVLYPQEDKK